MQNVWQRKELALNKMEDWAKRLDMFLNFNEYPYLGKLW